MSALLRWVLAGALLTCLAPMDTSIYDAFRFFIPLLFLVTAVFDYKIGHKVGIVSSLVFAAIFQPMIPLPIHERVMINLLDITASVWILFEAAVVLRIKDQDQVDRHYALHQNDERSYMRRHPEDEDEQDIEDELDNELDAEENEAAQEVNVAKEGSVNNQATASDSTAHSSSNSATLCASAGDANSASTAHAAQFASDGVSNSAAHAATNAAAHATNGADSFNCSCENSSQENGSYNGDDNKTAKSEEIDGALRADDSCAAHSSYKTDESNTNSSRANKADEKASASVAKSADELANGSLCGGSSAYKASSAGNESSLDSSSTNGSSSAAHSKAGGYWAFGTDPNYEPAFNSDPESVYIYKTDYLTKPASHASSANKAQGQSSTKVSKGKSKNTSSKLNSKVDELTKEALLDDSKKSIVQDEREYVRDAQEQLMRYDLAYARSNTKGRIYLSHPKSSAPRKPTHNPQQKHRDSYGHNQPVD